MEDSEIKIAFSPDEALVLFDFLWRYSDTDRLAVDHQAEQRALWDLCCKFESILVEPLKPNYEDLLDAARERLKDDLD